MVEALQELYMDLKVAMFRGELAINYPQYYSVAELAQIGEDIRLANHAVDEAINAATAKMTIPQLVAVLDSLKATDPDHYEVWLDYFFHL